MRLIDADALSDLIIDNKKLFGSWGNCLVEIASFPTVDAVEVKHGHWGNYLKQGLKYICSVCNSRFETPWGYCPNCGEKMDESTQSNDSNALDALGKE